ncbi:MAG: prepilin-type N-terminal cleavage/methylation domain-containing protein [Phycisphaerales bacterium]|nr:prepilin-type N-terminal cleavage/methylation domain-containing protein [Phycisphaerales bacterium]
MSMPRLSVERRVRHRHGRDARATAFTLIEMLITVVIMGIAGALVIPAMGETGILKVQAAVRSIVADITFAQSDAVAFQERRAIMFDVDANSYRVIQVPGSTLEPDTNTLFDPTKSDGRFIVNFNQGQFGDARILSASFDGEPNLIYDALGGPVADPSGAAVGAGGTIVVQGSGSIFTITVEPFTGRVTITRADAPPGP